MIIFGEILLQMVGRMIRSCGKFDTAMVLRAALYMTELPEEL